VIDQLQPVDMDKSPASAGLFAFARFPSLRGAEGDDAKEGRCEAPFVVSRAGPKFMRGTQRGRPAQPTKHVARGEITLNGGLFRHVALGELGG
jgi:hypothetical protein